MPAPLKTFLRAFRRVFLECQITAQAVAFTMFLAFFPFLLFCLGLISGTHWAVIGAGEIWSRLQIILPPTSAQLVQTYLGRHGHDAWRWISFGLFGTLLIGTQAMSGLIEGFHIVARDPNRPAVYIRQLRALALLCLTIIPWGVVVSLTVFGKQARAWLLRETGFSAVVRIAVAVCYFGFVFILGVLVLMVVYRVGRRGHRRWEDVFPGAVLATALWWIVDFLFGAYMRHMPYGAVYGGVVAVIGLMIWMYLSAMVVFIGAAYNAESRTKLAPA